MTRILLILGAATLLAANAQAQRSEPREGRPGDPRRGFVAPRGFHLMTALDTDKDGKLSAKEIENATAALRKLDKNKDGKLSPAEIGWPPPRATSGRGGSRQFRQPQRQQPPRRPNPDE